MKLKCKLCEATFEVPNQIDASAIECPTCGSSLRSPHGTRITITTLPVSSSGETARRKRSSRKSRPEDDFGLCQLGPDALTYSPLLPLALVVALEQARTRQWPLRLYYSDPIAYGSKQLHEGFVFSPRDPADRYPYRAQVPHATAWVDYLCEDLLVKVERLDGGGVIWEGPPAQEVDPTESASLTCEMIILVLVVLIALSVIAGAIWLGYTFVGWLRMWL